MAGNYHLQKGYLYIGGIFSVFYFVVGLFVCTGRLSFWMSPSMSLLFGCGIIIYSVFRAFMFFRQYKAYKREKNGQES